jgi:hypothetical protein
MSVNNFKPTIWSASMLQTFKKNLVLGSLCNTDYQGEISNYGDSVKINEIGEITINDYTRNSTTAITVQELTDAQQMLLIDRAKYFAFKLDDVDQAQTNPKLMPLAMDRAAYNLKDNTDVYIAQKISSDSGSRFGGLNSTELGSTTTALSVTSTLVINMIAWMDRIHNQNNVPVQGRWIAVSPAIAHQLVTARIIAETQNTPAINSGVQAIGNFYNYNIYLTNNIYSTYGTSSQHHIIAGHSVGLTFASQINKVEAFRDPNSFSDIVKGLLVYGFKVTRPSAILRAVVTP